MNEQAVWQEWYVYLCVCLGEVDTHFSRSNGTAWLGVEKQFYIFLCYDQSIDKYRLNMAGIRHCLILCTKTETHQAELGVLTHVLLMSLFLG